MWHSGTAQQRHPVRRMRNLYSSGRRVVRLRAFAGLGALEMAGCKELRGGAFECMSSHCKTSNLKSQTYHDESHAFMSRLAMHPGRSWLEDRRKLETRNPIAVKL